MKLNEELHAELWGYLEGADNFLMNQ